MNILIIENDVNLSRMLTEVLSEFEYKCDIAKDDRSIISYLKDNVCDMVILDTNGTDNVSNLIKDIKDSHEDIKVCVIGNDNSKEEEILSFRSGGDEYFRKPFDLDVFIERIFARLRRKKSEIISINNFKLNYLEESVFYNNKKINVRGRSFEVLSLLAKKHGLIVSREDILDTIWNEPESLGRNVVDVAISRIREAFKEVSEEDIVITVRGKGHKLSV